MKKIDIIVLATLILSGINWGLWGVFEFDLIEYIFGSKEWIQRLVYVIFGVAGIYVLFGAKSMKARFKK